MSGKLEPQLLKSGGSIPSAWHGDYFALDEGVRLCAAKIVEKGWTWQPSEPRVRPQFPFRSSDNLVRESMSMDWLQDLTRKEAQLRRYLAVLGSSAARPASEFRALRPPRGRRDPVRPGRLPLRPRFRGAGLDELRGTPEPAGVQPPAQPVLPGFGRRFLSPALKAPARNRRSRLRWPSGPGSI